MKDGSRRSPEIRSPLLRVSGGEGQGEEEARRGARLHPQVPSALTFPHSYVGQQVAGSVPVCLAQAQMAILGQATMGAAAPVDVVVGRAAQVGHL